MLTTKIKKLTLMIQNERGHLFLYGRYEKLLASLRKENISEEECKELHILLNTLINESRYFSIFPYWSARCFVCADGLIEVIPNEPIRDDFNKKMKNLYVDLCNDGTVVYLPKEIISKYAGNGSLNTSVFSDIVELYDISDFFVKQSIFNRCNQERTLNDGLEVLNSAIIECFNGSDAGRRPHLMEHELRFYHNFLCGYRMTKEYLLQTKKYSQYEQWFLSLSPIHIGDILASIPEDRAWDELGNMIDDTLTKQIEMLEDWKQHDIKSFSEFNGDDLLRKCLEY